MTEMMKKPLSILLSILMIVGLFASIPFTASADSVCTETIVPANFYGMRYNEEGDPEGERPIDYKGTYVNAHPNNVDIDGNFADFSVWPMDFDEEEESRCFIGITAKNEKVISGIDVTIDSEITNGQPLIYVGDSTNAVYGVRKLNNQFI